LLDEPLLGLLASRNCPGRVLLEEVNKSLEDHETLDYVVVVKDQWTMENGFLTPTMKIKRNVIEERYMPYAGHWITRKQKVIWED